MGKPNFDEENKPYDCPHGVPSNRQSNSRSVSFPSVAKWPGARLTAVNKLLRLTMSDMAFQDYYSEYYSSCYGCGSMNQHGLHIKSYWDGENTICHFMPKPYHTAFPGYVYGGLIASIMDCHAIGSAAAALYKAEGRIMGSMPSIRCVTASLKVEFLKPTPIDCELTVRGVIREVKTKKVILDLSLEAMKLIRAKAEIIAVRIPENYTV